MPPNPPQVDWLGLTILGPLGNVVGGSPFLLEARAACSKHPKNFL